ncbi:MAG: hypothetical protein IKP14_01720 [Clostridiales bacterium]|nr:hypothetical protein [Clostridiales bacterium]
MWYEKEGNNMDVVLSTKIVLNRNIKGFPFPPKMSDADRENVLGMARQAAGTMGLNFVRTDELEDNAKEDLYNQFYAGYAFLNSNAKTGYLMSKTEGLGVIINNTDHISIVSMVPGTDVVTAYKRADDLAVQFEKSMDIAYTDKFGFLTSQIKSVGTGMQLMMTLALPGIEKTEGAVQVLAKRVEKYDWQMIPMTHSDGIRENGIYVLTNVATLGITEQELIDKTRKVQEDIIKLENSCRKNICTKKKGVVEDQYYRAYATLSYCRRIETAEALTLINWLRLGQNYIDTSDADLDWNKINKLTQKVRRNYTDSAVKGVRPKDRASARAAFIRDIMKGGQAS